VQYHGGRRGSPLHSFCLLLERMLGMRHATCACVLTSHFGRRTDSKSDQNRGRAGENRHTGLQVLYFQIACRENEAIVHSRALDETRLADII
jgi:hypothetical protein